MRKWIRTLTVSLLAVVLTAVLAPHHVSAQMSEQPRRTPVVVIPGIGGSALSNGNELVWLNLGHLLGSQLPGFNLLYMNWLMPLRLAADGSSPYLSSYRIQVGDIMRQPVTDGYGGLIRALTADGYAEGRDLWVFPYDWRKDPAQATERLSALVERIKRSTGAPKVILVGHSLGGLIARDYLVRGGATSVEATVSIGTPWLGAPVAYRALAYGWDMGLRFPGSNWSVIAGHDVRLLVQNYPSVYSMAPSRGFFDWYPQGWLVRAGRPLSYDQALAQGLGGHNRTLAYGNAGFLERLQNGKDYGVKQFLIAGTGRSTLGRIAERKDWFGVTHKAESMVDGDEVVPLYSADLGYSKDPARAAKQIGQVAQVAYVNFLHGLMAQSPEVQSLVTGWVREVNAQAAIR